MKTMKQDKKTKENQGTPLPLLGGDCMMQENVNDLKEEEEMEEKQKEEEEEEEDQKEK